MVTWDEVDRLATSLPEVGREVSRAGLASWKIRGKGFLWERPLRKADYEALGDAAPDGPILGVRVPDLMTKDALLAANPRAFFTTPHFDGYAAILVLLEEVDPDELRDLMVEAWLSQAPKRVARAWREGTGLRGEE